MSAQGDMQVRTGRSKTNKQVQDEKNMFAATGGAADLCPAPHTVPSFGGSGLAEETSPDPAVLFSGPRVAHAGEVGDSQAEVQAPLFQEMEVTLEWFLMLSVFHHALQPCRL